jgi:hypothetical protein
MILDGNKFLSNWPCIHPKMDMKKEINMCFSCPWNTYELKLSLTFDINNNELLKTIWKHKKKKKKKVDYHLVVSSSVKLKTKFKIASRNKSLKIWKTFSGFH